MFRLSSAPRGDSVVALAGWRVIEFFTNGSVTRCQCPVADSVAVQGVQRSVAVRLGEGEVRTGRRRSESEWKKQRSASQPAAREQPAAALARIGCRERASLFELDLR